MKKLFLFFLFLTGFFLNNLSFLPVSFAQTNETLTITTYYPAPYGVYNELRSKRMAIGDNYYNGTAYCWPPAVCTNTIDANADLVVEGNVGIGTAQPRTKLHIESQGPYITFYDSDEAINQKQWVVGASMYNPGNFVIAQAPDGELNVNGNPAYNRLTITNGGNVGIGTAGPSQKLDVNGNITGTGLCIGSSCRSLWPPQSFIGGSPLLASLLQ